MSLMFHITCFLALAIQARCVQISNIFDLGYPVRAISIGLDKQKCFGCLKEPSH